MTDTTLISKDEVIKEYYWLWPLFCLQAGLINSGGFLACQQFVSHVTGFGTRIGMEFLNRNFFLGLEMLLVPIGFILGCAVAGFFHETKNRFTVPLWLMSGLLALVSFGGSIGVFGSFGEELKLQRDFLLLFLLCFSCGLQNGLLASITAGVVRTTHMTGIATDLGLSLSRILSQKKQSEKVWFKLRLDKMVSFALGATLGTMLFALFQFQGFLIPAILNLALFFVMKRKIESRKLIPQQVMS